MFQAQVTQASPMAPQISLRPAALQELTYLKSPDFIVVGSNALQEDPSEVATIKKILPQAHLIAEISEELSNLAVVEQLVRFGIEDIFSETTSAEDFFRKILVLSRKESRGTVGKLVVVDGVKGGVGTTSIVAAMGSLLRNHGKKVCVMDLDTDTQDLTRFLQVRPFVNENLTAALGGEKCIVKELTEQMYFPVEETNQYVCVPPPMISLQTDDPRSISIRSLLAVMTHLDHSFDIVIIDMAGLRGALAVALQKLADLSYIVVNPDIASMSAAALSIRHLLSYLPDSRDIRILQNNRTGVGLSSRFILEEIASATKIPKKQIFAESLPFSRTATSWPASGKTLLNDRSVGFESILASSLVDLGLITSTSQKRKNEFTRRIYLGLNAFYKKCTRRKKTDSFATPPERLTDSISLSAPMISLPIFIE